MPSLSPKAALLAATSVAALASPAQADTDSSPAGATSSPEIVVTAQRLDAARASIQPQLGASTYTLSARNIEALPAGENAPLNQVLLQAPGVAQDSFGQLHIRDEHNALQYRLNGIILPEGLTVFSQALNPRIAGSVQLITGALPAEYGLRTGGIVDITTKSGAFAKGGSLSVYGGSHSDIEPSVEFSASSGTFSYFATGGYRSNDLGIESPDGSANPIHDHTQQYQGFAYLEDILDANSRLSAILGVSDQTFQIPNVAGQQNGGLGLVVDGQANFPSEDLNETQREISLYGVLSYLRTAGRLTLQASIYGRYSSLKFTPDVPGDILYNGVAQAADKRDADGGLQIEGAYPLSDAHTLRGGLIIEVDHATTDTTSQVLLVDNNPSSATFGQQLSDAPVAIVDRSGATAETYSVYLQDEWKLLDNLTLNYGLRFDQFNGFRSESQVSPRANLVWSPQPSTTLHLGYARYFSPPPFELIANEAVGKFVEPVPGNPLITSTGSPVVAACGSLVATVRCPLVTTDTNPFAERANYFDVGAGQKFGSDLSATIDAYDKISTRLVDEGQFGAPIILTPFNYAKARQYGVELTLSFAKGPFSAYANAAYQVGQGRNWISSQFNFRQSEIDYVMNHDIFLDHDERVAASAGATYTWRGTRIGADLIFGSGLRAAKPLAMSIVQPDGSVLDAIPNGAELPSYVQVNFAVSHKFDDVWGAPLEVRFDVINVFDQVYQIRDGTGVGVFAPQFGPRRGFFLGASKEF